MFAAKRAQGLHSRDVPCFREACFPCPGTPERRPEVRRERTRKRTTSKRATHAHYLPSLGWPPNTGQHESGKTNQEIMTFFRLLPHQGKITEPHNGAGLLGCDKLAISSKTSRAHRQLITETDHPLPPDNQIHIVTLRMPNALSSPRPPRTLTPLREVFRLQTIANHNFVVAHGHPTNQQRARTTPGSTINQHGRLLPIASNTPWPLHF